MKSLLFTVCFALVSFLAIGQIDQNQESAPADGPVMDLESLVVDYGTIEQHSEPLRVLKFTNTGTAPLIIKSARGSCGCTVPDWPKEPIMPGEESQLEIRYATNRLGKFAKTVTLTTNEEGDNKVIKVQGHVNESEQSVPDAPANIFKDVSKKGSKENRENK